MKIRSGAKKIISVAALCVANGFIYGLNAIYYSFVQIYLEQYHPHTIVGILLAIGPFISIIAPMVWGVRADKAKYKNSILTATVGGSAIFFILMMFNHSFWWFFIVLLFLMFFMAPFGGLIDIVTLEYTYENNVPYGPIRLTGTLVFGLIPLILARFTEKNINVIFYSYAAVAVICIAAFSIMPKVEGKGEKKKKFTLTPIIKDYKYMLLVYMVFIVQLAWAYYTNFFPIYIINNLGLSQQIWGLNVFVTIIGEIPFFLFFNRIFNRIGIKKILFFAIILSVVRYISLAIFADPYLILSTALITGASVTVFTYCCSIYITEKMPLEIKTSAQTFMYAVASGLPKMIAGVFGGYLTETIGVKYTMFILVGLCATTGISYFIYVSDKKSAVNNV